MLILEPYPEFLEAWWMEAAASFWPQKSERDLLETLEGAARRISDGFTGQRAEVGEYRNSTEAWLAYGLFFFPQTYMRIAAILAEVLPHTAFEASAPLRLLDLGAGTGAATVAALQRFQNTAVEATAMDTSTTSFQWLEKLGAAFSNRWKTASLRTLQGDLRNLEGLGTGCWDVVLCSYALNEALEGCGEDEERDWLEKASALLSEHGLLIICEPTIYAAGPRMTRLRTWALEKFGLHVLAPCLHEKACPMADGVKGYCHDVRRWQPPASSKLINRYLFRSLENLKFSFLALGRHGRAAPLASGPLNPALAMPCRLVAPVLTEKGYWKMCGCFADGLLRKMEILQRAFSMEERKLISSLERGDQGSFELVKLLGDGKTHRAIMPIYSPDH